MIWSAEWLAKYAVYMQRQALAAWHEIRGVVVGADAPTAASTTQGEPDHDNNDCARAC